MRSLYEMVNLRQLAVRVVHDHLGAARQAGIELSFEFGDDRDAFVMGDVFQLQEAIANLVSNALKYTPRGGKVTLRVQVHREEVVLTVEDNGYGIPEAMQRRLFSAFYRAATKEASQIEGTGLGLHLVKNIVERHNGRTLFHSEYGKGSTFGFALPLHHQEQAHGG
jgi:signal transduction histidine kinase